MKSLGSDVLHSETTAKLNVFVATLTVPNKDCLLSWLLFKVRLL